ncbi:RNA ligase/cyclic nucleotide phosphodiesterase [Aspergillus pseudoustus]|uniref:RNA ligase/cyclic nucleotide phosphodiesterase n=1 Tax=Aspergillus pseudoustus TaxID=1810923 RepID=A0ABR4JZE3_9EURO
MAGVGGSREPFSFPPQQAGEPSTRNWYQELLDHPNCQNNTIKIQEAYEQFRTASLTRTIASCLPIQENGLGKLTADEKQLPAQSITPDAALIRYLRLQKDLGGNIIGHRETEELSKQNVNCLVIWARPDIKTLDMLRKIQNRLSTLVGPDLHLIPPADIHLSVIELSHRHSVPHLRSVYDKVGETELKRLLDVPGARYHADGSTACLVKPMIMFDKVGVAVGFVPAEAEYTHHHLRNQLHTMALATGVSIDTCYTAPLAHVTVGRFVGNAFFEASDQGGAIETKRNRIEEWIELIRHINKDLQREYWGDLSWVVGGEKGLEVQLGYVKFGRGTDQADLVGDAFEARA